MAVPFLSFRRWSRTGKSVALVLSGTSLVVSGGVLFASLIDRRHRRPSPPPPPPQQQETATATGHLRYPIPPPRVAHADTESSTRNAGTSAGRLTADAPRPDASAPVVLVGLTPFTKLISGVLQRDRVPHLILDDTPRTIDVHSEGQRAYYSQPRPPTVLADEQDVILRRVSIDDMLFADPMLGSSIASQCRSVEAVQCHFGTAAGPSPLPQQRQAWVADGDRLVGLPPCPTDTISLRFPLGLVPWGTFAAGIHSWWTAKLQAAGRSYVTLVPVQTVLFSEVASVAADADTSGASPSVLTAIRASDGRDYLLQSNFIVFARPPPDDSKPAATVETVLMACCSPANVLADAQDVRRPETLEAFWQSEKEAFVLRTGNFLLVRQRGDSALPATGVHPLLDLFAGSNHSSSSSSSSGSPSIVHSNGHIGIFQRYPIVAVAAAAAADSAKSPSSPVFVLPHAHASVASLLADPHLTLQSLSSALNIATKLSLASRRFFQPVFSSSDVCTALHVELAAAAAAVDSSISAKMLEFVCRPSLPWLIRNRLAFLLEWPALHTLIASELGGTGMARRPAKTSLTGSFYNGKFGPVLQPLVTGAAVAPGRRFPVDSTLDFGLRKLPEILSGGRPALFLLCGSFASASGDIRQQRIIESKQRLLQLREALLQQASSTMGVDIHIVLPKEYSLSSFDVVTDASMILDSDSDLHRFSATEEASALWVLPDGYLLFVSSHLNEAALLQYCKLAG